MRNDVRLEGWKISAAGAADDRFLESVFFTGSGVLGARGYPALRPECILSWDYLQKVDAILKEGKRTAFVCTADEYALEIMKDQKRAKRKAPVDYGITGFDNIDTLAYVTPQLSTISNVVDEVAKSAVEMLFAMIDAEPEVEQMTGDSQRILSHRYLEGETL